MKTLLSTLCLVVLISCQTDKADREAVTCFMHATIIDGTGNPPVENASLLVSGDIIRSIGAADSLKIPPEAHVVDLSGKFIIPGLINGHGHVGDVKGIEPGHYSADNIRDNLRLYARYGITSVFSLGGDRQAAEAIRQANDPAQTGHARLFIAGEIITGATPAAAEKVIIQNDRMGVDLMKIRVDDQLGTTEKMPEEVYRAVISKSHELGYKIATHMYYLEDARKLLEAGSDLLAHSVRDKPVDPSFIELIKERHVGYCPTLTRELSTFIYADTASFFTDPYFTMAYDSQTIAPLLNPENQSEVRNSRSARIYREQLTVAMENLRVLASHGVPIVFGTDSGMPTRFIGYFEHLELEMMQQAGLSPMAIIVSATKNPAEFLGLNHLGTLQPGNLADFLILDADPLEDVTNIRKIRGVYINGREIRENMK